MSTPRHVMIEKMAKTRLKNKGKSFILYSSNTEICHELPNIENTNEAAFGKRCATAKIPIPESPTVPSKMGLFKEPNTHHIKTLGIVGIEYLSISFKETLLKDFKETYLYKINVPENTKLVFYSNITFFENNNQTLPLGMDISQEGLINMDKYKLELKGKDEFNINIFKKNL